MSNRIAMPERPTTSRHAMMLRLRWPSAFPHVTVILEVADPQTEALCQQLREAGVVVRTLQVGLSDLARHLRRDMTTLVIIVLGTPDNTSVPELDATLFDRLPLLEIPVIAILTGNAEQYEPWLSRCDDLLAQPFDGEQLALRARVVAARRQHEEPARALQVGQLCLDPERYQACFSGLPLNLSYKEFEILRLLMHAPDRVVTRELLLSTVWQDGPPIAPDVVDAHVRRLRKKLEEAGSTNLQTIRRRGFVLRSS